MQEQIDIGNFVEINLKESRKNNQLYFVGYNFMVSCILRGLGDHPQDDR